METRSVGIEAPLDLRRTLHPLLGRFARDGWWLAARTPAGPGTLRVHRSSDHLIGSAWGAGSTWMLERLPAIAGLDDDPGTFRTEHPLVSELHRRNPGLRFGRTGLVFDALVAAVCRQKVTHTEAGRAMHGLRWEFSSPAPGPDPRLRLPPDPERMAAAPYWAYHRLHLERRRAEVLRRIAKQRERIEGLGELAPPAAAQALVSMPGVGPWTVAETLAVSHGDPDQVSVGDFHLKNVVAYHLTGRDRGTDEEMLELLEPFRPHRGRVIRLLELAGQAPAYGPRLAPRDITRT